MIKDEIKETTLKLTAIYFEYTTSINEVEEEIINNKEINLTKEIKILDK